MPWTHPTEFRYSSVILDFGTRWRWVVGSTHRLLYPRGKSHRYLLDRPQSRLGLCGKEKKRSPISNRTPAVQPVDRRYTDSHLHCTQFIVHKVCYWMGIECANQTTHLHLVANSRMHRTLSSCSQCIFTVRGFGTMQFCLCPTCICTSRCTTY
jgi:hypothetical protein